MKSKMQLKSVLAAGLVSLGLLVPGYAIAGPIVTYNFGTAFSSGSPTPTGTFATMSVYTLDNLIYHFTLSASGLNSAFGTTGTSAFISTAWFNTSNSTTTSTPDLTPTTLIDSGTWGVNSVTRITSGFSNTAGINFEFSDTLGCSGNTASCRLTNGESVSWTATFASAQNDPLLISPYAGLHVQGLGSDGGLSGKYLGTPTTVVPEPGTLLLLGLGFLGLGFARKNRLTK